MMWKSLDNALLICELFLLVAAIVTCAAEVTDYSKVSFFLTISFPFGLEPYLMVVHNRMSIPQSRPKLFLFASYIGIRNIPILYCLSKMNPRIETLINKIKFLIPYIPSGT